MTAQTTPLDNSTVTHIQMHASGSAGSRKAQRNGAPGVEVAEHDGPSKLHGKTNGGGVHGGLKGPSVMKEMPNMVLLVILYMMQGVPLGLTMGSMPFLLQARASYTQIGVFSLAGYPYSFKLFWSPVVDSLYSLAFGRRKTWIVPLQLTSAVLLVYFASWTDERLAAADITAITALFFVLVLLAATQDIAVDGWALTLLSRRNVGYAATCQTIGMNVGYFTSFTVFLALNDADFCNQYLRAPEDSSSVGIVTLTSYLKFWGWAFILITAAVAVFKRERSQDDDEEDDDRVAAAAVAISLGGAAAKKAPPRGLQAVSRAYFQLWGVMSLPAVRRLSLLLLTCRLGMLPAESASPLKLLEKGVSKEALAGLVLMEFPCELLSAVVAGRWATLGRPYQPWLAGYAVRLVMAVAVTCVVYFFPANAVSLIEHPGWFLLLALLGLITSFTSTLMFTAIGSFYNRISDPEMGGAYLTLLNTIANMGIILPKLLVFALMDWLTVRACEGPEGDEWGEYECPANALAASKDTSNPCLAAGGACRVRIDGFYPLSLGMSLLGAAIGWWLHQEMPRLDRLPIENWRAKYRTS